MVFTGAYQLISLIKNNSKLNYLLPALSIIPFMFAIIAVIVSNYLNIIFLVVGFLICQILDEILFKHKSLFQLVYSTQKIFDCSGCNIDDLLLY